MVMLHLHQPLPDWRTLHRYTVPSDPLRGRGSGNVL